MFDANRNKTGVNNVGALTILGYAKENRLSNYPVSGQSVSYTNSGDMLIRTEWNARVPTMLV